MWTLHAYILRELLKTFGLSLTGLTILFTIGGGLYNILRIEGISAGDMGVFLPMLLPIAVTVTMPIAALFSVTMVYGRLSADNELLACRAVGINIHRTFWSAFLLSVFVTAFTLLFGGFVIPSFVQRIEAFARKNVRGFVAQQLQQHGFLYRDRAGQDRIMITAERVQGMPDAALRAKGFEVAEDLHYLLITDPVFVQIDPNGELVRFTTARYALCVFDARGQGLAVTLHARNGQYYVLGQTAVEFEEQQFGPAHWNLPSIKRLAFAPFDDLLYWYGAPWDAPRLSEEIDRFLETAMQLALLTEAHDRLAAGRELTLADPYGTYHLRGEPVELGRRGLTLGPTRVTVQPAGQAEPTRYEAQQAEVYAQVFVPGDPSTPRATPTLLGLGNPARRQVDLYIQLLATPGHPVRAHDARSTGGDPRALPNVQLELELAPEDLLPDADGYTRARVADPTVTLPADAVLGEQRAALQREAGHMRYTVIANLNFRLGMSASALVTLIMGAALGVIFRGARALMAFALGLIPFFSVLVLMVLGRQITEAPQSPNVPLGLTVTWGGLVLVALVDLLILRVGVRR